MKKFQRSPVAIKEHKKVASLFKPGYLKLRDFCIILKADNKGYKVSV